MKIYKKTEYKPFTGLTMHEYDTKMPCTVASM